MTLSMFRNDICVAGDIGSGGSVATLLRTKKTVFTHKQREREREAQLSLSLLLEFTVAPGHQPLRPPSSGRVSFVDLRPLWCIGPAHVFLVYMNQAVHVNKLMTNTP